jgi:transcription termination/antitermination protein NusG
MNSKLVPNWYVLHTKSRFETVVADGLARKSVEAFLPKISVRSKRRDRKVVLRVPLFPGYVFVKTDLNPNHHLEIVKTAGAVRLIGNQTSPVAVPEENITSLKIMVTADEPIVTGSRFTRGDRVMVVNGPFRGVTGLFSSYKGRERVMVEIEALCQYAAVEVDLEDIELLPKAMP